MENTGEVGVPNDSSNQTDQSVAGTSDEVGLFSLNLENRINSLTTPFDLNNDQGNAQVIDNEQVTFATVSENLDVHIHSPDMYLSENNLSNSQQLTTKILTQEEIDRREFFRMMKSSSAPTSRLSNTQTRKTTAIKRDPSCSLSENEISAISDSLMKGKKLSKDDLKDPGIVCAIVKELDARRVQALNNTEYLKSKKIGDVIENIKFMFFQADRDVMFQENLDTLKQKHQEALDNYEETKNEWKQKHADFVEECKNEVAALQTKQENEKAELDAKWMDPSTQRRFTKRSPTLLQQKAVEKYMVLVGDLEEAEQRKKQNLQTEKFEIQQKYLDLQESYEISRKQLVEQHNTEITQLQIDQEYKYRQLLNTEQKSYEICRRRIALAQKNLDDQSDMQKFLAKKFKRSSDSLSGVKTNDELPQLSRGKGLSRIDINRATEPRAIPLVLPQLKVRQSKQPKVVIHFK